MKLRTYHVLSAGLAIVACVAAAGPAKAATIVYEGFTGYAAGNVIGQQVNSNTVGFDQSTSWITNDGTHPWNITTGLTLGSGATTLQASGGAISHANGSALAVAKLDIDAYTGTLYSSYLVQVPTTTNANVHVVASIGTNTADRRFRAGARTGSGTSQVGVDYLGNSFTNGTGNVNSDTATFMILARYTLVGEALSGGSPGVATLWALSSDQFDHFKSTGFADIDTATVGSGATNVTGKAIDSQTSGTVTFDDTLSMQFGTGSTVAAAVTFDELRMGDSFDAVTPVPEPGTIISLGVASLLSLATIRRRMAN